MKAVEKSEYKRSEGLAAMIELQKEAENNNLSGMSLGEINAGIASARAERKENYGFEKKTDLT